MTSHLNERECEIDDKNFAKIAAILDRKRGFRLTDYKNVSMKRRVAIRMRVTNCRDVSEYCKILLRKSEEPDLLLSALTIHVSHFFRNPSLFDALRDRIFPEIFTKALLRPDASLRIWCMGCAEGEEPYSLAILLKEYFASELAHIKVVIRGTDIDAGILSRARLGEYGAKRLKEIPPLFLKRYFKQQGKSFQLIPEIMEMVTFNRDSITRFSQYESSDLIMCRNTLIYFTRPEQERIQEGIADILPLGGVLVLGKSETLTNKARGRFTSICPVERIYRRIA